MVNIGDYAGNGGRAPAWRPNESGDFGARALARSFGRPLQLAPFAAATAAPIRAQVLGGPYGASWRDSPDILFALRLTADGAVFDAINPACERSLGLTNAGVAGRSLKQALSSASSCRLLAACRRCAASAQATRLVHAMPGGRRQRRWDTTLTPICDEDGAVFLILGRSRDIGEGPTRRELAARQGSEADRTGHVGRARTHALSLDRDGRIVGFSPQAARWMGVTVSDYLGRDAKDLLIPGAMVSAVETSLATGRSSQVLVRSQFRPGRWVEFEVEPTGDGAEVFFRDLPTDAGAPEIARRAEAADYGHAGDTVEMALLDRDGVVISVNSAWRATFAALQAGQEPYGVQMPYEEVCRRIVPDLDPAILRKALRELVAGEVRSLTHAFVVVDAGIPRWRQIRVSPLQAGVAHFIATHEDLTELGRTQAARRRTTEQLLSAQRNERHRIAVELHDSAGEYLEELGLGVSRLRRLMSDNTGAQDILDDVAVSLKEATREIRVMSSLMKPASLHRHGLETATRRFVDGFAARTGLRTVFRSEGPVDQASSVIQHAAFRVVQEALSNVHRHAHANGVEVGLASGADELTLRIADDGRGIQALRHSYPEGVPPGVGIPGMLSRVEQLGGSMKVASDRTGTAVIARIPLRGAATRR